MLASGISLVVGFFIIRTAFRRVTKKLLLLLPLAVVAGFAYGSIISFAVSFALGRNPYEVLVSAVQGATLQAALALLLVLLVRWLESTPGE